MKVMLKTMWGEKVGLMLLSWSILFVGGRVVRQGRPDDSGVKRWEVIEVGRRGSCEGSKVGKVGEQ